jgi:hypothetical protein
MELYTGAVAEADGISMTFQCNPWDLESRGYHLWGLETCHLFIMTSEGSRSLCIFSFVGNYSDQVKLRFSV